MVNSTELKDNLGKEEKHTLNPLNHCKPEGKNKLRGYEAGLIKYGRKEKRKLRNGFNSTALFSASILTKAGAEAKRFNQYEQKEKKRLINLKEKQFKKLKTIEQNIKRIFKDYMNKKSSNVKKKTSKTSVLDSDINKTGLYISNKLKKLKEYKGIEAKKLKQISIRLKEFEKKEKKLFKNNLQSISNLKGSVTKIGHKELNKLRAYKTKELEKLRRIKQAAKKFVSPQNTKNLRKSNKNKEPLHQESKALKQLESIALKNLKSIDVRLKELEQKGKLNFKGYLHKEATKLKSAKQKLRNLEKRELDAIKAYRQNEHNKIKYLWSFLKRFSKGSIRFLNSIPAHLTGSISKKEAKNHGHLQEANPIRRAFFKQLSIIKKEKDLDKSFDSFCWILKSFIRKRFHINYEFTFEELIKELENKKLNHNLNGKIVELYSRMKEFEYAGGITEKKLKTLIKDTEDVVGAI